MERKLAIAVVGSGVMGGIHSKIAHESGEAEIKYIVDTDETRARGIADLYGAQVLSSVEQLEADKVDLAFVCVPNNLHAGIGVKILEHGINVFCEKPMATSLADAQRMLDTAEKHGKRLFVGHNRRFAPVYAQTKNEVDCEGYRPHNINIIQNDGDMGGEGSIWAANFEHLGGFLYDTTIHFLDMAEYLMGEIIAVSALAKSACYPVEDDFAIQLKFADGGIGAITSCGHASWIFPFERVQVVGDHKSIITEELDSYRYCPGLSKVIEAYDYSKLSFEVKWGYVDMHKHMLHALRTGQEALNDGAVGLRAVRLVEACQQSARQGGILCQIGTEE